MAEFGLLGRKLGHSHSPMLHKILGGYDYALFEIEPDEISDFFDKRSFEGINVTVPYKKAVISFCDELSEEAERIGSVNTIRNADGRLIGYNTDCFGFCRMVERIGVSVAGKKCLVLGNGGVAPTVRAALHDLGAEEIVTVSRCGEDNYVNLHNHYDAEIIVNATPVGMYPDNGKCLVDLRSFPNCSGVLDLVYNPLKTALILQAEELGIKCSGGLYMLIAQAAAAVEIFTGKKITDDELNAAHAKLLSSVLNIILIGMPGCGKSTTGLELCKLIGREFIDSDDEIVKRCKCSIPEYFDRFGEDAFRKLENEVLVDITKKCGCIIATGGGVVTRKDNLALLRQNGFLVFLDRDISTLPTDGRPISQSMALQDLAAVRLPLYRVWADITISAGSPLSAAQKITEAVK